MVLDEGTLRRDRRAIDVLDDLDRVGIAHREHAHLDRHPAHRQRIDEARLVRREGHVGGREARRAHVDRHFARGFDPRTDHAARGLDADLAPGGEALVEHEAREAARAVAALLDLAAVGVEDAVAEIVTRVARPLHQQHLVAADAEVAVGEGACLRGREVDRLAHAVQHDEVVALALHLREADPHAWPLYGEGSPGGRVLKRLCAQKYCSGISRTRSSMNAFIRRTSASRSPLGKSAHAG